MTESCRLARRRWTSCNNSPSHPFRAQVCRAILAVPEDTVVCSRVSPSHNAHDNSSPAVPHQHGWSTSPETDLDSLLTTATHCLSTIDMSLINLTTIKPKFRLKLKWRFVLFVSFITNYLHSFTICPGIMFSGCPSVSAPVRACVMLAWYLTNQRMELHQTLVDDVVFVEGADELISK